MSKNIVGFVGCMLTGQKFKFIYEGEKMPKIHTDSNKKYEFAPKKYCKDNKLIESLKKNKNESKSKKN